ncbi:hypothetical protein Ancab_003316 [Ancistrocladus abbreviatus]
MTTLREGEQPNAPTAVLYSGDRMAEISPKTPPSVQKNACFYCGKVGHWSKACPKKAGLGESSSSPHSATFPAPQAGHVDYPIHYCRCGRGICIIWVSKSKKNPDRKFYRCPGTGSEKCSYFKWCDELKEDEVRRSRPDSLFPVCRCGAGVCTLTTDPSGRSCFICPIKKGQGACDFVQWQDVPNTTVTGESSVLANVSVTDNNVDEIEPDILGDPSDEILPESEVGEANDTRAVLSLGHRHPAQDAVSEEGFLSESTAEGSSIIERVGNSPTESARASDEFLLVEHSTESAATEESPSAGIAESPFVERSDSPFTEPEKRSKLDRLGTRIKASRDLSDSVSLQSLHGLGSIMAGTISQAFDQLGTRIKANLITLLLSMDPSDHKKMRDEVDATINTLISQQLDHEIFYERVKGYIKQAEWLAKINEAKGSDMSEEELIEQYYAEKSRFHEISRAHSGAVEALAACSERLQSARKDESYLKDLLLEVEMELASCEAETAGLQARVVQITEKMSDSKKSFESASRAAAEPLMRSEQREIELSAAKAAFEKARAQLKRECL